MSSRPTPTPTPESSPHDDAVEPNPDDTTTSAAQEPQPDMVSPPSPPTCSTHNLPQFLTPQLPQSATCPSCTISRHMRDIKDVQNVLRARGGVFFSRGRPKSEKHRTLMDRWRKAKVELLNLVGILERSMVERPEAEWKDAIGVLAEWEKEKEVLAMVPGCVYEGSEVKLSDEVSAMVNQMLEGLKNSVMGLLLEDGPEVVVAKPGEVADQGSSTLTRAPSSTSVSIAVPEDISTSESTITAVIRPRLHPILKRKSIDDDSPAPPKKRIRLADFATVSSEVLTISNPSPFLVLSTDEPVQPHSRSTSAELKRRKSNFNRLSERYIPGAWSSPAFCTKPNTSCFKLSWNQVEELWKEEEEEVAEEKRVHEQLKIIAEVYVMSWWVRGVAGHVGLEKVAEIGQAKAESNEMAFDGSDEVS
ncbi:hypothetical protein K504DRAFT_447266 [Pleomassaria siparia CBS 279.74]|uniref:Uncharacterized protein n=1 Tax=Pleomassaria siparia CBS 279.74 TaxID=1314801 RepID=A0A6G1K3S0_9PLEO|nr:hypothetical protein K504DRAFT_447266 [Pleomassaria siparia CBS 279.74]